jgi:hypothetical protein
VKAAPTSSDGGALPAANTSAGQSSPREELPHFQVPSVQHILGGLVHRHRSFWLWLGRLESSRLAYELEPVAVKSPIYVCGLARSGSTLLHEIIASHPRVATHRIKDYPMVFTPYWWRRATARQLPQTPRERPHRDKMMITTESPDAIEEMVWMAFFPKCHDPSVCHLLTAGAKHPAFESFYRAHIRKLLLAERADRYAAKANYHVARIPYLLRLFPDAKFLIPIRAPESHIASLMRQHQWFSQGQRQHRRALAFMQRSGHFEFGLDRRPMNLGDRERVRMILRAWDNGEEVRGWAMYWAMVHGYLARLLASEPHVRASALVVRFESMCAAPAETLRNVAAHCLLPDAEPIIERYAPGIRYPDYYRSRFSPEDLAVIREETAATASLWGY